MHYFTENKTLTIGSKKVEFPFAISHSELFEEVIIVIIDSKDLNTNENVWGINNLGERIWQIPKIDNVEYEGKIYSGITSPYTGIYKVDNQTARIFNWEGGYYEINPKTGLFTKNIIEFRKGKRPW